MGIFLFGLTGLKFSGKSVVSKIFRKYNVPVVDLDALYTDMLSPGTVAHQELITVLGSDIINIDGSIDITKLSILVCKQKWIKITLDSIMENYLDDLLIRLKNAFTSHRLDFAGIESGVILGSTIAPNLNSFIIVEASEENRINRMLSVGMPKNIINLIINEEELGVAENAFVIKNDGDIKSLERSCEDVLHQILQSTKE